MVCLRIYPAVPVIAQSVIDLPVHELDHEARPSGIVIPLAGVLGAGEAVVRRELKRPESVEVMDPRIIPLRGREVVHQEIEVVGNRAGSVGVGVAG